MKRSARELFGSDPHLVVRGNGHLAAEHLQETAVPIFVDNPQ